MLKWFKIKIYPQKNEIILDIGLGKALNTLFHYEPI
jgi:hypothetical protein